MKHRLIGVLVALGLSAGLGSPATAQTVKDLVGTWAHVENVNTRSDGTRIEPFGADAKGSAIFTENGRFSIFLHRSSMPKFASNNRTQGTADENKAIVEGMIALYGTYTLEGKTIMLKVEGSSFPNWVGTTQPRPVSSFTGDEMVFGNVASSAGGSALVRFKRIK
jgi:hypothetical protein